MNEKLYKKLLINALKNLNYNFSNDGCNDIYLGEKYSLFEGVTKKELKEIEQEWIKTFPYEAAEIDNELICNMSVVDVLIKKVKETT